MGFVWNLLYNVGWYFFFNVYVVRYVVGSFYVENEYRNGFLVVDVKMYKVLLGILIREVLDR